MSFFSQFSALRPWNRNTASSWLVGTITGGTELLKPCGSSSATYGILLSSRDFTGRSAVFLLNQLPWRNSTAIRKAHPPRASRERAPPPSAGENPPRNRD